MRRKFPEAPITSAASSAILLTGRARECRSKKTRYLNFVARGGAIAAVSGERMDARHRCKEVVTFESLKS
jgi:hypothetical protein